MLLAISPNGQFTVLAAFSDGGRQHHDKSFSTETAGGLTAQAKGGMRSVPHPDMRGASRRHRCYCCGGAVGQLTTKVSKDEEDYTALHTTRDPCLLL